MHFLFTSSSAAATFFVPPVILSFFVPHLMKKYFFFTSLFSKVHLVYLTRQSRIQSFVCVFCLPHELTINFFLPRRTNSILLYLTVLHLLLSVHLGLIGILINICCCVMEAKTPSTPDKVAACSRVVIAWECGSCKMTNEDMMRRHCHICGQQLPDRYLIVGGPIEPAHGGRRWWGKCAEPIDDQMENSNTIDEDGNKISKSIMAEK